MNKRTIYLIVGIFLVLLIVCFFVFLGIGRISIQGTIGDNENNVAIAKGEVPTEQYSDLRNTSIVLNEIDNSIDLLD
jgi:hypothetical protein